MAKDALGQLAAIRASDSVLDLRAAVVAFVRDQGFPRCYFLSPIARDARAGRVLANVGFSRSWERAYRRHLYLVDPLPALALASPMPFRWGGPEVRGKVDREGARYLDLLARAGMADGLVVPTFGPQVRCGMMGLGGHRDLDAVDPVAVSLVQHGVQLSYLRYCELLAAEREAGPALSNREMDVLYWITQGKSNAVIATVLGISAPTVDTYLRRIFTKLDVADRTAAAIGAVERGLFIVGAYRTFPEEQAGATLT